MKHIKLFEQFDNYEDLSPQEHLQKLYNGIMNDASIRRYTLQWKDVIDLLNKRFSKKIKLDGNVEFSNNKVVNALNAALDIDDSKLEDAIEKFAIELDINIKTLRDKFKRQNR